MLEDKLLAWQFRKGSRAALRRIYEKYYDYLLTVATALLHDVNAAEDVVHDSFLKLSESTHLFKSAGQFEVVFGGLCFQSGPGYTPRPAATRGREFGRIVVLTERPLWAGICRHTQRGNENHLGRAETTAL